MSARDELRAAWKGTDAEWREACRVHLKPLLVEFDRLAAYEQQVKDALAIPLGDVPAALEKQKSWEPHKVPEGGRPKWLPPKKKEDPRG